MTSREGEGRLRRFTTQVKDLPGIALFLFAALLVSSAITIGVGIHDGMKWYSDHFQWESANSAKLAQITHAQEDPPSSWQPHRLE